MNEKHAGPGSISAGREHLLMRLHRLQACWLAAEQSGGPSIVDQLAAFRTRLAGVTGAATPTRVSPVSPAKGGNHGYS